MLKTPQFLCQDVFFFRPSMRKKTWRSICFSVLLFKDRENEVDQNISMEPMREDEWYLFKGFKIITIYFMPWVLERRPRTRAWGKGMTTRTFWWLHPSIIMDVQMGVNMLRRLASHSSVLLFDETNSQSKGEKAEKKQTGKEDYWDEI